MSKYSKMTTRTKTPKIIIFSGAGLSAESGIQTFRDSDGTWENHKIDEVCNEHTWKKNFDLVHRFYNERREQLEEVEPNEAHKAIRRIQEAYPGDVVLLTQNVDDLLERAGCEDVIHLHGNLSKLKCEACGANWDNGYHAFDTVRGDNCPKCSSVKGVRPDIVFFYGQAPEYSKMYDVFDHTIHEDTIVIVTGTMGNVVNIDSLVSGTKCTKILNNLAPSPDIKTKRYDHVFFEGATTAFPQIEEIIKKQWKTDD